jgi:nucleoside-diphosphate-sugar epimerase
MPRDLLPVRSDELIQTTYTAITMRIFVAGATGAVGKTLLPLLVAAGHSVVGLTRTPDKVNMIRKTGADAVVADAFELQSIINAVAAAAPEVIVHELTSLSGANDLRHFDRAFAVRE